MCGTHHLQGYIKSSQALLHATLIHSNRVFRATYSAKKISLRDLI